MKKIVTRIIIPVLITIAVIFSGIATSLPGKGPDLSMAETGE